MPHGTDSRIMEMPLSIVILAAGKGTRMKSDKAKVLHEVFFAPMLHHVLQAVLPLEPDRIVTVVGHQREAVVDLLRTFPVQAVVQQEQLGTGHAVLITQDAIPENDGTVMILCGDTPLIQPSTLRSMYEYHLASGSKLTLMTTLLGDPTNYGRIISDQENCVQAIVEQKDCSPEQLCIQEINGGIYCVDRSFLFEALAQVGTDNSQGEIYLTDIVGIGVRAGLKIERFLAKAPLEVLGVNSRAELAEAHCTLQQRRNRQLMLEGVSMYNPHTVTVAPAVSIGRDSVIDANVTILGSSQLGTNCVIGQGSILQNCTLGENVVIGPYCLLSDCSIPTGATIAPLSKEY
jgi:bifunctional UDP-N-acetylglucosamine pyrophosphorylase/glucosamine-1-phosphate N-acetyltransferase